MPHLVYHPTIDSPARKLESQGFENAGAETGDNLLYEFLGAGECVAPDDVRTLKRFRRLSLRRWAKWFFTDAAGNPSLVCVAPRDDETS